ncbi:MAG TPA: serine/threonine-protein kinase, partial [Polyangiaceae bacterium]
SAAMLKALLLYLDAEKGTAAGDTWLRSIRAVRDDFEDETRSVPRAMLHVGLRNFVEVTSREAVLDSARFLLVRENSAFWSRVLARATTPFDAYAKLDAGHGEYARTMRWEVLEAHDGIWRGRVHLRHDPEIEKDGLLTLSRAAMVAAVPALFGYDRAHVTVKAALTPGDDPTEVVQELEARWKVPTYGMLGAGAVAGAALGGGFDVATHVASPNNVVVAGIAAAAGIALGAIGRREQVKKVESAGQAMRVRVLERNLALQEARSRLATGSVIGSVVAGEYRILRPMGAGATGVIYEARRIRDDLPVALKLLRAAAAHESVASDRLRREAEALGLAWHPNVVEVIDHGHLPDGTAYLVMELLTGESLRGRLRTKIKLTTDELLPIALAVCDALAAIHAAGVVHRDIKPGNIFLQRIDNTDGSLDERVKVVDFGIARVEWEEMRITNIGSPVGTPGYMSPEQESGVEVDARSDLFALGASLYECLVGETPPPTPSGLWLVASNETAPKEKDTTNRTSRIQSALREVAPEWRSIIEKALMPNPEDRFQDARTFGQALRNLEASRAAVSG